MDVTDKVGETSETCSHSLTPLSISLDLVGVGTIANAGRSSDESLLGSRGRNVVRLCVWSKGREEKGDEVKNWKVGQKKRKARHNTRLIRLHFHSGAQHAIYSAIAKAVHAFRRVSANVLL